MHLSAYLYKIKYQQDKSGTTVIGYLQVLGENGVERLENL